MTLVDESPREVHKPTPLCTPKENKLLGIWNVRTMYATGKTAEVEREMDRYNIEILALNEVTLQNGKVLFYSGRNYGLHQAGVGMMLSNRAQKKHKIETDTTRKRFDTTKLQRPEVRNPFSIELKNMFQLLDELEDIETFWEGITKCCKETATNMIGFKERGHKPCISNESWKLVDERRQLKEKTNNSRSERVKNSLNAKYSDKDKEVKKTTAVQNKTYTLLYK
ncbi:unnamed protein product [Mytilus coruscus]|uniref:Endonuclease/exonuclease/phosphatase domain-containing protein n=1 Tax=Mytilus coruscus TaxID=42192 RepID=A0A6J8C7G2_MYTCO|nr:unnamed protein product [Mytilus coruscus]